jgi:type II secretory pathway component PulJ
MSKQAELDVKDEEIATLETRISQLEADLADTVEPEGELADDEEDATEAETETETETTVDETE